MLTRILVANRGEIAMRVIRAARQLGIETVAAHSTEDADTLPVSAATRAVCVGPAAPRGSYLNQESIIQSALSLGCDAIHPGYGFLSENAEFAQRCRDNGIAFIGPEPEVIRAMGDKQAARELMRAHGIPTVPGSDGLLSGAGEAAEVAARVGYPVLLKATAGGGGRGMRVARDAGELAAAYGSASAEAASAFGNGGLYLERLIERPRHVEVQVMGDSAGRVVHLGERDCTLQRRNQKMVEESPAYSLDAGARERLREAALDAARAVGYTSAGTVEFVLDRDGAFYFIEMNTRVQVEHPVTEMATGVDIVRQQLLLASGEPLSLSQDEVAVSGSSIECRVIAENPDRGFAPSPGTVASVSFPCGEGVRVESAIRPGSRVSPWYDSLVAKVIVHAGNRAEAIRKMSAALDETRVEGVATNLGLLRRIMADPGYVAGSVDTSFIGGLLEGDAPAGERGTGWRS